MEANLVRLLDEVRLLFHGAEQAAEVLHAEAPVTVSMRAVLEQLDKDGAQTVPDIARARLVSRQHIQGLVNALAERELVDVEDNPAHRRSSLVRPTQAGARLIRAMQERERRLLARVKLDIGASELGRAAGTLAKVRAALAEAAS